MSACLDADPFQGVDVVQDANFQHLLQGNAILLTRFPYDIHHLKQPDDHENEEDGTMGMITLNPASWLEQPVTLSDLDIPNP